MLTIEGNHAEHNLGWREAIDFYANTCAAWGDVAIGEDDFGIWVSGIVRPGTSSQRLHAARASVPSGDWRRIGANLELVASLNVNTGGFPIPRPKFASFGRDEDFPLTVIGAGAMTMSAAPSIPSDPNVAYLAQKFATAEARDLAAELTVWDL